MPLRASARPHECRPEISFPRLGWKLRRPNCLHQLSRTDDRAGKPAWSRRALAKSAVQSRGKTPVDTLAVLAELRFPPESRRRKVRAMAVSHQEWEGSPCQQTGSYSAWSLANAFDPKHALAVDLAWHSRVDHGEPERHKLLPFSEPSIAIRRRFSPKDETLSWDMTVFPARHDVGEYCPIPGEELFALRLAPEQMELQFGMRVAEYSSGERPIPASLGAALEPAMRLADNDTFHAAWRALARGLVERTSPAEHDRLAYAARLLRHVGGRVAPSELAAMADISPRHLRRGFAVRFGIAPKALARRLRVTGALLDAERSDAPHWADIAAGHRFSDQAHFIRECRALVGDAPSAWHANRRNMSLLFNT